MAPSTKKMTRRSSAGHILPKSPMFWNMIRTKLMTLKLLKWLKALRSKKKIARTVKNHSSEIRKVIEIW